MSDPKFWTIPVEVNLCGYVLKFRYPSIEAAADANEIREAGAAEPPTMPFRERMRAYWTLISEHIDRIERDGVVLSDADRDGLMASTVFAPWINQIAMALFFRDTLYAVADSRGGSTGPGPRSEGSGEDSQGRSGQPLSGLPDDVSGERVARLAGDGAAQRGMVSGVRKEEGAVTGDAEVVETAGSNGRGGRVRAGGATGGRVGRNRKATA